jgi:hypothetical protein
MQDGSNFCGHCGASLTPGAQQTKRICHIRSQEAPTAFGVRKWYEAWCGSALIAESEAFQIYDDGRLLLKGTTPEESERWGWQVRQAFLDKLMADGWEPF